MKFVVWETVSGDIKTIEAKTPKQAAIKYLKSDYVEGNKNLECEWDLIINRKHIRKVKETK